MLPVPWKRQPPFPTSLQRGHRLAKGLVSYWPMSERSGPNTRDAFGANNASVTNGPSWAIDQAGVGASLNNSQYVNCGTSTTLQPAALTISMWAKFRSFPNSYGALATRFESGTQYLQWFVKSNGTTAVYIALGGGGAPSYDGTGAATLVANTWYHLAFVWELSAGLTTYVNAVVDGTSASTGTTFAAASSAAFVFGEDLNTTGRLLDGIIADASFYSRPLSPSEVQSLYADRWQLYAPLRRAPLDVPAVAAFNAAWNGSANTVIQPGVM